MTSWQIPNVHSPTGSIDSGVGLSPRALAYGAYEDISPCSQIYSSDGLSPGSPTTAGGSSNVIGEPKLAWAVVPSDYRQTQQLTPDELECLSNGVSDYPGLSLSPSPSEDSPVSDLPELTEFEKQLNGEQVGYPSRNFAQLDNRSVGPCDDSEASVSLGTLSRKRRQRVKQISIEDAHPGLDACLVPKKGTSKPRQSRKKPKLGHAGSTNGGATIMKPRINTGARVKETARERLNRVRLEMQREGMTRPSRSPQNTVQNPMVGQLEMKKEVRYSDSHLRNDSGPTRFTPGQRDGEHYNKPSRHTVEDILCPTPPHHGQFQGRNDSLDQIVYAALQMDSSTALVQHIQRASATASASGQTTFHTILEKLNQRKDQIPPQQIQKVTKLMCEMLRDEINMINYEGESPVYRAALYGNIGALRALADADADLWIKERSAGEVALHAAIRSKSVEAVRIILSKAKETQTLSEHINTRSNGNGNTPLHNATALRDVDLAVQNEIVTSLLTAGADASCKNYTNEMAHALLPEGLRELQNTMKRLNSRRRSQSQQHAPMPSNRQVSSSAYIQQAFPPRYPTFPANFSGHIGCPGIVPFGQAPQLTYISDFQPARPFAGVAPPHFPTQLESYASHFFPVAAFGHMPDAHASNYTLSHSSDPDPLSPSTVASEYSDSLDDLLDTFSTEVTNPNV